MTQQPAGTRPAKGIFIFPHPPAKHTKKGLHLTRTLVGTRRESYGHSPSPNRKKWRDILLPKHLFGIMSLPELQAGKALEKKFKKKSGSHFPVFFRIFPVITGGHYPVKAKFESGGFSALTLDIHVLTPKTTKP